MCLKICLCFCKYAYKLLPFYSFWWSKGQYLIILYSVCFFVSNNKIQIESIETIKLFSFQISCMFPILNILLQPRCFIPKNIETWFSDCQTWRTHKKCILCKFIIKPRESKAWTLTSHPGSWHISKLNKI